MFLEIGVRDTAARMTFIGDRMIEAVPGLKAALGKYAACFFFKCEPHAPIT